MRVGQMTSVFSRRLKNVWRFMVSLSECRQAAIVQSYWVWTNALKCPFSFTQPTSWTQKLLEIIFVQFTNWWIKWSQWWPVGSRHWKMTTRLHSWTCVTEPVKDKTWPTLTDCTGLFLLELCFSEELNRIWVTDGRMADRKSFFWAFSIQDSGSRVLFSFFTRFSATF